MPPAVSAGGFSAALTNDRPKSGRQCVLLQGGPNVEINENSFGNIMQTLDATPYRGKRIHFHAVIRLQAAAPNDQARIWLRVDRANGTMGLFNNMSDHPLIVSDKAWHDCRTLSAMWKRTPNVLVWDCCCLAKARRGWTAFP